MPCPTAVTSPAAAVAVVSSSDVHVAVAVRSAVEPSVYVPVATRVVVSPCGTRTIPGSTAIDTSVAVVTVSMALPDFPPYEAVMVVPPTPTVLPVAPAMVATPVADDVQVATPERSWVVASV